MNEPKRLTSRNEQIAAMLADGEQLKNFYRFIAQNPHINLHDACQIIIERPNATVCFSFSEWAAMERRVTKGRKGIAYYDNDGYKQFVFDANDTHGDNRYSRPILPMKCLLGGLDELNGTDIKSDDRNDYRKIHKGVQLYLQEQGELSGDELSNKLLVDGIAFSLYAKTGFPKSAGINLSGLPFSYTENAAFVKEVYVRTDMLVQDIEEAYSENKQDVQIIDDTEEVVVSDEPIIFDRTDAVERVHIDESKGTYFRDYLILVKHQHVGDSFAGVKLYLGKTGNFDENSSLYDNTDGSLLYVSDNANFGLLFWESGFYLSQQELIDKGTFTADDYKKFAELKSGILANVETDGEVLFAVDDSDAESGLPFRYPNWQVEQTVKQTEAAEEKPTHPLNPIYKRYTNVQKRLVALHHLDTPYRPSDMEQREGRIIRQGNENKKVDIYTYVTERTFDSYSYQILENKQKFISQINKGDLTVREAEDIDETTLSYAEIKAITAANPKIKRKMEVDAEISRLRVLEGQYKKNLYELQDKILKYFPEEIRKQELLIERVTLDTMHLQASKSENPDAFEISVNGNVYTDRKEGGKALTEALYKSKPETVVAEYCGFKISINPIVLIGAERDITLSAQGQYTVQIGESATGNLQRIDNFIEDLPKRKERLQNRLQQIKDDLQTAKEQVEKPFEHNEQLLELLNEQTVLNAELDLDKKDDVIVADDGEYDDNYRALPTQRRSDKEDDIIDKEDKIALMQVNAIRLAKSNSPDFEEAVINSVLLEFDEYKKELEKQSVQDVFDNSYKTHIYERLTNVVECGREIFEDNVYRALYEDKGHILESLYDAFIDNYGYYSLDENEEAALMIEEYCKDNYNEIYCPTTYYGKDTENRAYYRFTQNITAQNIGKVKESKAEMYTIAAPSCSLSQEELERNHIFYLNIGRDIEEEALADDDKAMSNMMHAMDNYKRIYPLYLQTGEYAHDHYEIIAHRNSRKSNIECKLAIEDAIRNNFDGMYLSEGIEDKIIEQYGMERVAFVVANTVNEHSWDGRFSRENKEWAKTVPMSEDENVRRECCLNTHPAVLDSFVDRVRKKIKENKENQELDQNAVNAAVKDGENKKWISFRVSSEAALKRYQLNTRFKMPKGSGYEGCAYSIFNDRIRESKMLVNLDSDGRELAYEIRLPEDYKIELYEGGEKIIDLRAWELAKMVDGTTSDKYEREARVNIRLPREAVIKDYDASVLVAAPTDSEYKRYVYYLPSSVVKEDTEKDNGSLIANVGENFKITLRKGEEKIELTAKQFAEAVSGKTDYKREPTALDEYREQQSDDDKTWRTVHISENAVIAHYQNSTLFKMPKGEYAGLVYYLPSGMVRKNENGLSLRIPEDFVAHLKDGDEKKDLSSQELIAAIEGKTDADYESVYRAPSEEVKEQFAQVERNLRANVPEEMRCKPNWVVVRTRKNNDTGRLDKFLINPHTGKFAESDNPETWSDFDTACKYAKENGGVCLAYALDGKDGIACVDLDGCVTENGYTEIANRVLDVCGKTYIETSVSGKGLHIFGKTKGADLRSFSKDKTMEYYQGGHFIAMTGDGARFSRLESFDTPVMQAVLESKLEKRTEWKNTGMGVEGLSSMGDREMLDRAFAAKNGDTVRMLYNGEDVRGNHSNSDMSLMNYLAFWSNHDIDQMLRVFSTSGLYRPDKPQSYYEHTAIKAVKGTPVYTPPKSSDNAPKSSGGNGKR